MNSYEFSESATEMHAQADADWWKDLSDATVAAEIADFQDTLDSQRFMDDELLMA
jgi:hypothetical protein